MKLLLSQKNKLFDLIERCELTSGLFEYKEIGNIDTETTISLRNSSFSFSIFFDNRANRYNIRFSPGDTKYNDSVNPSYWRDVEFWYSRWLEYLKREILLEDRWEKLNSEIQSLQLYKGENDSFNSKFTVPEYLEIKQKIFQLKEGISKLELLPEQISILNDKLDLVLDMTTQLGRFDWKSLFVGTIVSIIIQLGVTQDNAKAIWALIKQVFHNYFIGQ